MGIPHIKDAGWTMKKQWCTGMDMNSWDTRDTDTNTGMSNIVA